MTLFYRGLSGADLRCRESKLSPIYAFAGLGFDDFAAAQAGGADSDALGRSAYLGVHRAQIHVPAPLGDVMGVADIVSELRPFAAEFTYLCH
jgi:hypothetical protein